MKKLDEKEWEEFTLEDIFSVGAGKRLTNADKIDGDRPFIGATDNNNGVTGFVGNDNASLDENVLGVNYNGAPCIAFYHPYKCLFTDDVKRLHLQNHADDEHVLLFMKGIVMQQRAKYSYGYKFKEKRMLRQKLMLPVNDNGKPDYGYMEQYVSEMKRSMLTRYINFVTGPLSQLEYKDIPALDEKEWEHFLIPDIFSKIQRGKRLKNADHIPGDIPYVSSTANNNGVDDYIEASHGTRVFKDCISLANSGSVGTAFYEPFSFVASDHVTSLKIENGSKFVYLFLVSAIEKQGSNFNFNREINDLRIKKMQVMLPIDDDGKPDYAYMEQYAKNMMLRKYEQYLAFLSGEKEKA